MGQPAWVPFVTCVAVSLGHGFCLPCLGIWACLLCHQVSSLASEGN
jgi:hypothetical protein